ncbi:hypothetical protein P5673_018430, partial [Acropora cervicornis]
TQRRKTLLEHDKAKFLLANRLASLFSAVSFPLPTLGQVCINGILKTTIYYSVLIEPSPSPHIDMRDTNTDVGFHKGASQNTAPTIPVGHVTKLSLQGSN